LGYAGPCWEGPPGKGLKSEEVDAFGVLEEVDDEIRRGGGETARTQRYLPPVRIFHFGQDKGSCQQRHRQPYTSGKISNSKPRNATWPSEQS
jgi:hypothetical protein